MTNPKTSLELLAEALQEILDNPDLKISGGDTFASSIPTDSLDHVEIVMHLEDLLRVEISDEDVESVVTVDDAVKTLDRIRKGSSEARS